MASLTRQAGQPLLILKQGTMRTRGRNAQRNNIMAARIISEALKSTLGPRGMDKMLVGIAGGITITNDGAAILKEIQIKHPTAKMMVDVAETQDDMVGDGTTTAVILAGELLRRAEELLNQNIHPTAIVNGYKKAAQKGTEILNKTGILVDIEDRETLKKVAMTAMASKAVDVARTRLADIAVDAVKQIVDQRGERKIVDIVNVQIVKKEGESLFDTQLIRGFIIDKEVIHAAMPKRVESARIALLNSKLEIKKGEFDAAIRIKDSAQMQAFLDKETSMFKEMVAKIKASGANVVFCQKGIDDVAQHLLAKKGILATRNIKGADMERIARATGGKVIAKLDDLKRQDLGNAGLVEERKIGEGGGAIESEIAKGLRDYATKIGGREQLAIEAFAEALEIVPKTLAENAGLDPIDILVALRSAHEKPKGHLMGVDVFTGKIVNMHEKGVIEPLRVKEQAVKSATEVASAILRVDDVIAATTPKEYRAPPLDEGMEE
jgi:chaperonin GroEL (HSP60 family)